MPRNQRKVEALVIYSSSDGEDDNDEPQKAVVPIKKLPLPSLSTTVFTPAHVDNPALHQGRIRSSPHVDGQFAVHIYVSLVLKELEASLRDLVLEIIEETRQRVPTFHTFWSCNVSEDERKDSSDVRHLPQPELHVSLSRPIFVRAHQRGDMKRCVRDVAREHKPFLASFVSVSDYSNDERTRGFLGIDVGAGYHELQSLLADLHPVLENTRQQAYYDEPRFHASVGWVLLDSAKDYTNMSDSCSSGSLEATRSATEFPTIPCFPRDLVDNLNERFAAKLAVCRFEVADICMKIGEKVSHWGLGSC
ncbi:hypothetical protein FISHEDRAFT_63725 [Fistulina hepatica ATCC 64428]|uniref:U6 snRNA phosphodiesterase 1 n=1 Tax=Fistulina hepatica ATCC 64428 TaxID=1128425 RepID=A0A0D7APT7_9AGAR|nr:hypothetical protein FISHEDRAFT_63725 [Fistulina hepatica ATCC 64428]